MHELKLTKIRLDEKQEAQNEVESPQEERIAEMFFDEDISNDFDQKPCFAKKEEQSDLILNNVMQNDIQWGLKTLQRFLTSFGLL